MMAELAAETPQPLPSPLSPENELSSDCQTSSFTFPLRPAQNFPIPDSTQQHGLSIASTSNKSMHKRARTSINKLPDFSFSPGASTAEASPEPSQLSLSPAALNIQSSPNRGRRHRRSASEYVGGNAAIRPIKVDFSAPPAVGHSASPPVRLPQSVQTQDTTLEFDTAHGTPFVECGVVHPSPATENNGNANSLLSSGYSQFSSTSASSRVLFADEVELIPRPSSDACSDRGELLSPSCDNSISSGHPSQLSHETSFAIPLDEAFETTIPGNDALEQQFLFDTSPASFIDRHQPDENFDDDPTGTEVLNGRDHTQYGLPTFPSAEVHSNNPAPCSDAADGIIDLDQAFVPIYGDFTSNQQPTPQGRTFQTARRSMHSSGVMSGFVGSGMHYHRRAESEPLLASFQLERTPNSLNSGMGMENVFEEEEEEEEESTSFQPDRPMNEQVLEPEELNAQGHAGLGITVQGSGTNGKTSRETKHHQPDPIIMQHLGSQAEQQEFVSAKNDLSDVDSGLGLPQPPFVTPETPSGSSFSSPKRLHFNIASSEPSLTLPQSTEDVPSLVSSRSTVASGAVAHQAGSSLRSVTPRLSGASSSGRIEEQRRKRSSIASLSRLIGSSHSDTKSETQSDCTRQNSDGRIILQKSKPAKLKRLFALWHRKNHAEKD